MQVYFQNAKTLMRNDYVKLRCELKVNKKSASSENPLCDRAKSGDFWMRMIKSFFYTT